MTTIEQTVDVTVPVRTAYNQWTQFEEFPRFMEGVDRIEQLSETRTHWSTSIAGVKREFDAEIVEQRPDERIAWQSVGEPHQAGVVSFHYIAPEQTRISLRMIYAPEGVAEKTADKLHLVEHRVKTDLERFKRFIEERGTESGGWRGEVTR
jgi:uncharacterized membrane protein